MNFIWAFLIIISLICGYINGCLTQTVNAGFDGAKSSADLILSFAGVMCLWCGLMKAGDRAGLSEWIKKILSPITKILFPTLDKSSKAMKYITMNMTANLFGMGNGATPMGIRAMEELNKYDGKKPTDDMCIFTVINTASLGLIPSTVIALRSGFGSNNPFCIIVPVWIASLCSMIAAVASMKLVCRIGRRK